MGRPLAILGAFQYYSEEYRRIMGVPGSVEGFQGFSSGVMDIAGSFKGFPQRFRDAAGFL